MSMLPNSIGPSGSDARSDTSSAPVNIPGAEPQGPTGTRAAKACRRCHRKKLKCHGGCPCVSCKKAHQSCDFGSEPAAEKDDRLARLEKLVENLVGHINSPKQMPPQTPSSSSVPSNLVDLSSIVGDSSINHNWAGAPSLENFLSPSVLAGGFHPQPAPRPPVERDDERPHNTPESRFAMSQAPDQHRAPFRPLAFHPAHWEDKDRTRPPSPVALSSSEKFWELSDVGPGNNSDPIYMGVVDTATAQSLLDFFMEYCHPFLPVLDFVRPLNERLAELREMGPYLFTTVLAVASRYRPKSSSRSTVALPVLSDESSLGIRQLAYSHFASSPLRRHQNLRDIQATLILAGWGCHPTSEGPESWMSTGRCERLAFRLGLDRLSGKLVQPEALGNMPRVERIKFLERFKTWLCLWCLDTTIEVGFGRPTTNMRDPDELALLNAIDFNPGAVEDDAPLLYLVSLTRLNRIARELNGWLQTRDEKDRSMESMQPMLAHFNRQLDAWFRAWIWKGSRYQFRLKRFTRELKLRSEHLRLAINSVVLSATEPSVVDPSGGLGTASMAALELIQACVDSAEGDQYLTFCLDCICFIFGHALIFLIRLYLHADPLPIDRSMILHYLQVGMDTLMQVDLSINGQASHIARTCRDLCKAGGVPLDGDNDAREDKDNPFTLMASDGDLFADAVLMPDMGASDQYGTEWLLGLPGLGMVTGYET